MEKSKPTFGREWKGEHRETHNLPPPPFPLSFAHTKKPLSRKKEQNKFLTTGRLLNRRCSPGSDAAEEFRPDKYFDLGSRREEAEISINQSQGGRGWGEAARLKLTDGLFGLQIKKKNQLHPIF